MKGNIIYQVNPNIKKGISKLKIIELKDCFKIGDNYFFINDLKDLPKQFHEKLIFDEGGYCKFPLRNTEERAKKDLLKYIEKQIKINTQEIEYYEEENKRFKTMIKDLLK